MERSGMCVRAHAIRRLILEQVGNEHFGPFDIFLIDRTKE
ncbi:unnamed protein product [marine sediment metagenome]|uniref:Uncharacterized protein n=1 Tax=marine sediment metagenome TaxID=412755 RepID=X0S0V7_9ZZZZ